MKLKPTVDSLEEVEEKYRELYIAYDDNGTERFKLDVDGVTAHPDARALTNALERQKARVRELNTQVDTLRDKAELVPDDFDPDLYQRAVDEGVGGGTGKLPNEDEIRRQAAEAATKRAEDKAKVALDKAVKERDALRQRVEVQIVREALDKALDEAKVVDPALRRGARAILQGSIKVAELDGDFEPIAKDPDLGDIPVAEFVRSWAATDEGKVYVGARESAGGGAHGGSHNSGHPASSSKNPFKADTLNVTEQARLRREDPAQATKFMREAGLIAK